MEQMEDLLDMVPIGVVYEKMGEAVEAAFPDQRGNSKNAKRATTGTGKNA